MAAFQDHFDPAFFDEAGRLLDRFCRFYFRYQIRGLDRLPPEPCLIVGNHSALGTVELACMLSGWWRQFGTTRRVTGLMHDFFLRTPGIGHYYRAIGAVSASRENAHLALQAGHDVLVFPGGDLDACRPFYQPRAVHFGPRRGYARLALTARVKVVPLCTIGSHYTMLMAPGGAFLARALGLKRLFRTDRVPLPMHLVPPPVRITTEALPALDPERIISGISDENEQIEHIHRRVLGIIREAVARMRHDVWTCPPDGTGAEENR